MKQKTKSTRAVVRITSTTTPMTSNAANPLTVLHMFRTSRKPLSWGEQIMEYLRALYR